MADIPFFSSKILPMPHGFFTREGGVSSGLLDSLNCSYRENDTPENVLENRGIAVSAIGGTPKKLVTLRQVHSAKVVQVDAPWKLSEMPEADGLVTSVPGLILAIMSADCVPVLMADVVHGVIGAFHAGWRGLLAGVLKNGVDKMLAAGAHIGSISAAIGPCIHQKNYEVDQKFKDVFLLEDKDLSSFFKPSKQVDHYLFDLPGCVAYTLRKLRIKNIDALNMDTYTQPETFFSCRYAAHKGADCFGTQISLISLED